MFIKTKIDWLKLVVIGATILSILGLFLLSSTLKAQTTPAVTDSICWECATSIIWVDSRYPLDLVDQYSGNRAAQSYLADTVFRMEGIEQPMQVLRGEGYDIIRYTDDRGYENVLLTFIPVPSKETVGYQMRILIYEITADVVKGRIYVEYRGQRYLGRFTAVNKDYRYFRTEFMADKNKQLLQLHFNLAGSPPDGW